MSQTITVNLNVFDEDGVVVDGTTGDLTLDQASDIVDHASQMILMRRRGKDISQIVDELEEALVSAGILDPDASPAP